MNCIDVERELMHKYAEELCRHQLALHEERRVRMDTEIQRYFNSTPTRNAFARVMCLAKYEKRCVTRTEIAHRLFITRQAASVMVNECLDAGWISQIKRKFCAAPILMDALVDYVEKHVSVMSGDLTESYVNWVKFRQIMLTQLTLSNLPQIDKQ